VVLRCLLAQSVDGTVSPVLDPSIHRKKSDQVRRQNDDQGGGQGMSGAYVTQTAQLERVVQAMNNDVGVYQRLYGGC